MRRKVTFRGNIIFGILYLLILFAGIYGWVNNIITIYESNFNLISGQLILRIVGVFVAPLGAVMGWL
jgi:hypothetical protein